MIDAILVTFAVGMFCGYRHREVLKIEVEKEHKKPEARS